MKACVQRVKTAKVEVGGEIVGEIGGGLLIFLGIEKNDSIDDILWIRDKILNLRIFNGEIKHMDMSLLETGGSVLIVSQFTLAGDCSKGRRPDFSNAMKPETAKIYYDKFIKHMKESLGEDRTACGIFGADMDVSLINDGPVTLIIEK